MRHGQSLVHRRRIRAFPLASTIAMAAVQASLLLGWSAGGYVGWGAASGGKRAFAAELSTTPRLVRAGDHGVGRRVVLPNWRDLEQRAGRWPLPPAQTAASAATPEVPPRGLVVVMTSSVCPLSRKYLPVLARLAEAYEPQGVRFLLVAASEPPADDGAKTNAAPGAPVRDPLRDLLAAAGPRLSCVRDEALAIARLVGAKSTTDAVFIDAAGTIRYHGAVDDQYGLDYARDAARHRYLADAIDAVLRGERPLIEATAAPGCVLDLDPKSTSVIDTRAPGNPAGGTAAVTYHNRVSRILQRHCVECHRAGGLGPFALETPAQVAAQQAMIQEVVKQRRMPPWFARETHGSARWLNDRSLADADRTDLLAWLAGGMPVGDPAEAPLLLAPPGEWRIGAPDLVLQLPRAVPVKAEGTMPYQHVVVETGLTEERWVEAVEVQPSRRDVVHHVLVFVMDGQGRRGGQEPNEQSGFFAAYVPGNSSQVYPAGFAKRLPKGSRLMFQMHYTPNGQATADQTRLALRFAKQPPRHVVETVGIANTGIRIPPRAGDHAERASLRVPRDSVVLAFMPHMHLRGKAFRYDAKLKNGQVETLLDIPRYDFNWQLQYRLAEPLAIAAGTTLEVTGWFDNSDRNPANPDPERTVRWGPQTFDEMLLGYIEYYVPGRTVPTDGAANLSGSGRDGQNAGADAGANATGGAGAAGREEKPKNLGQQIAELFRGAAIDPRFAKADVDRNGRMTLEEAKEAFSGVPRYRDNPLLLERHFRFLDKDSDGSVTGQEFTRVTELGVR